MSARDPHGGSTAAATPTIAPGISPANAATGGHLLILNAGSSSLKFALYADAAVPRELLRGQVEGFGTRPHLEVRWAAAAGASSAAGAPGDEDAPGDAVAPGDASAPGGAGNAARTDVDRRWQVDEPGAPNDVHGSLRVVMDWLRGNVAPLAVRAIGHRIVHGGADYAAPVAIDDAIYGQLERLVPLAPLHEPHNLEGVRAARAHFPAVPQVACFDTAFHRGHDFTEDIYALPREYHEAGVRRYGFHGLSYEYVAARLAELSPQAGRGRVIVAHLGSGASACAIRAGRSAGSTMGFTALDGLVMGTRCGQIDPGVLLWLMTERGMDAATLSDLLYKRSGLKGLSGLSNDMRDLRESTLPAAREAIEVFVARLCREIGALTAVLQGLDALAFTAGIGENDVALREQACARLGWLGVKLDAAANAEHGRSRNGLISAPDSRVQVWVVPTDEEGMIARHVRAVLGAA